MLGELVQAAKQARQELERGQGQKRLPQSAAATGSSSTGGISGSGSQLQPVPRDELELAMWRGAAAQQLLFCANPRLVSLALRKLQGGVQLPSNLLQARRRRSL